MGVLSVLDRLLFYHNLRHRIHIQFYYTAYCTFRQKFDRLGIRDGTWFHRKILACSLFHLKRNPRDTLGWVRRGHHWSKWIFRQDLFTQIKAFLFIYENHMSTYKRQQKLKFWAFSWYQVKIGFNCWRGKGRKVARITKKLVVVNYCNVACQGLSLVILELSHRRS